MHMVNRIVAVYCEHALDSWMLRVRAQGIWTSLVILVLLNWNLNISG